DAGEEIKKETGNYVKANFLGLGKDDEHLFLSACAYAIYWRLATTEGVRKVLKAISVFPKEKQKSIRRVIGHGEDKLIVPEGVIDDKIRADDGNVNGAYIIGFLAQYGQREIEKILETSGAANAPLYEAVKTVRPVVEKLEKEFDSFLDQKSWLEEMI
ncbi:MAG: hypothetical protein PWQ35_404, partial [Patescibacteria group bacterium]|nr:hypothetical protein [Patescibacteria group bacterium]